MRYPHNTPELKPLRKKLRTEQTDCEKILWQKLRNKQFNGYKFYRQFGVGPYILDFYCDTAKLAIELDGGQHSERVEYDKDRTDYINSLEIKVIRFWNNQVMSNLDDVLETIWQEINKP